MPGNKRDKVIEKQLPGWRVAKRDVADAGSEPKEHQVRHGPSVGDLRRKFLTPEELAQDGFTDADVVADVDPDRDVFQVAAEEGGELKEAEIFKGRAKIVQG